MTWADDSTRRIDLLCPIDFSIFLRHYIRLSLFQQASKQATRTANTRPVFICYIQNAFIQCFLICFLPGQFSEALVYEVIQLSRLVHITTTVYSCTYIYTQQHTYKNYTQMIDSKTRNLPKQTFPSLSLPIALPRETMTRLSNSTDSRSLPNAGPAN